MADAKVAVKDFWRVAVVEDHLLQRLRTTELVEAQVGLTVVGTFDSMPEFEAWYLRAPAQRRPHLLILDLMVDREPDVKVESVRALANQGVRVLVLSALASPVLVRSVLRAGVGGLVGKRDSELDIVAAMWSVLRGDEWITSEWASIVAGDSTRPNLSVQEERALVLYASGLSLAEVATSIGVKPNTAKRYLLRVKQKYAAADRPVSTRLDLHKAAREDKLVD